jgi:hypothetical protein
VQTIRCFSVLDIAGDAVKIRNFVPLFSLTA